MSETEIQIFATLTIGRRYAQVWLTFELAWHDCCSLCLICSGQSFLAQYMLSSCILSITINVSKENLNYGLIIKLEMCVAKPSV